MSNFDRRSIHLGQSKSTIGVGTPRIYELEEGVPTYRVIGSGVVQFVKINNALYQTPLTTSDIINKTGTYFLDGSGTTSSPTKKLTPSHSGNTYFIDIGDNNVYVELPPPSDGLKYKFIMDDDSNNEGTYDFCVQTNSNSVHINGSIVVGGSMFDIVCTDGISLVKIDGDAGLITPGDWLEVICFNGEWYMTGIVFTGSSVSSLSNRA